MTLCGIWDPAAMQALLTWSASSDPDFQAYSLRTTPGPIYDPTVEVVVGTFPAGSLAAQTDAGLTMPGDSASFKVYVVTTGGETGSDTVVINRM